MRPPGGPGARLEDDGPWDLYSPLVRRLFDAFTEPASGVTAGRTVGEAKVEKGRSAADGELNAWF